MNIAFKYLAIVFVLVLLNVAPVSAADKIKTADYSNAKITLDGVRLNLKNPPVFVVRDGESNASLYLPIRELLEKLGYSVQWDRATNTVNLTNPRVFAEDPVADVSVYQDYKTVFDIENNKNYTLAQSGSFYAEDDQFLQLSVQSEIIDGTIDLLLFSPEGKEQRLTIGSESIKAVIKLTEGKWRYVASGVYNHGSIKIMGTVR